MSHADTPRTGRTAGKTLTVVLAEDNDDHAVLIEMALERASRDPVDLLRARNGLEAIDLVREHRPDLLLLDLKMPGKTGHEVLETLKEDHALRKVPVAVLTSSDRDEDIAASYGLGSNHFITKPEDPGELEIRLRSLLRNLGELGGIRRGKGTVEASGVSAVGPGSLVARRIAAVVAFVLLLLALLLFGHLTGALGG